MWTLIRPNTEVTAYRNTARNATTAVSMYGKWIDGVTAENTAENCLGVNMLAVRKDSGESAFNYFNRIVRNHFRGVCAEKANEGFNGGILLAWERTAKGHGYREVFYYSTEIRSNTVVGDPAVSPKNSSCDADLCFYAGGLWGIQEDVTGDLTNLIIENNALKNETYGIRLSPTAYGAVLSGNTFESISSGNLSIDPRCQNIVSAGDAATATAP